MRCFFLIAVALGAAASIAATATSAQSRDYPFCIKGEHWRSSMGDCSFETFQQCMAMASGRPAYCDVNPFFDRHPAHAEVISTRKSNKRQD